MGSTSLKMSECCLCCPDDPNFNDKCFCGCCPCPPTGCLEFTMIGCQRFWSDSPEVPDHFDGMCDCLDCFNFKMEKRETECRWLADSSNSNCGTNSVCGEMESLSVNPATGLYPETWGFSGKIGPNPPGPPPVNCGPFAIPYSGVDCEGMCIIASLCCARTGIHSYAPGVVEEPVEGHPCPKQEMAQCLSETQPHGEIPGGEYRCNTRCMCFEINAFNCYTIPTHLKPEPYGT